MNIFSDISTINCSDLKAVVKWHWFKMEEIEKYAMTDAQLKVSLHELTGGIVTDLGRNPSREAIISVIRPCSKRYVSL
jgi:hypothetical protein